MDLERWSTAVEETGSRLERTGTAGRRILAFDLGCQRRDVWEVVFRDDERRWSKCHTYLSRGENCRENKTTHVSLTLTAKISVA